MVYDSWTAEYKKYILCNQTGFHSDANEIRENLTNKTTTWDFVVTCRITITYTYVHIAFSFINDYYHEILISRDRPFR
jgi:hypothetical protein